MQCEQSKTGSKQKNVQESKSAVGNTPAGVVAALGRNAARLLRPIQYLAWIPAQTFEPSQKRTIGSENLKEHSLEAGFCTKDVSAQQYGKRKSKGKMNPDRKVRRLTVGSGSGTDENARSGENGPEQSIEQVSELVAYLKTTNQDGSHG